MSTETFSLFDLAPGKQIAGRYRIVKPHRRSGLSSVFEAVDERAAADGRCSLNVFPGPLFEGATQAAEFRASWKPWQAVRSGHVAAVREVLELPQNTTIVVGDFPGETTLRDWLSRHGRATPAQTLALGLGLLDGLVAIHAQGLVHGDIKPQTIFLDERSNGALHGCLVDGGITTGLWSAKHLGEHTALIGTPFYAPVEQFGGDSPDVQSDVYNLATVLFECAAGVLPWPGSTMLEVFQAKLDKEPPSMKRRAPKAEVPAALERAIVGGLLADRRQRYHSAAEFRDALTAVRPSVAAKA
jgi:eukaryotic-like serine/threonine-protein kinase